MARISRDAARDLTRRLDTEFATQARQSEASQALKSSEDLNDAETYLADDLLIVFYEKNRLGSLNTLEEKKEARDTLWDLVFGNNWDTNCPIPTPSVLGERAAVDSTIMVGTLDQDAETSNKRKASGEMSPPPPHRCRGAEVFIKVNVNWAVEDLTFPLCDARGRNFAADVAFTKSPGLTWGRAKGDCTGNWDRAELRRLGRYNTSWLVYWTRQRLLFGLAHGLRGRDVGDQDGHDDNRNDGRGIYQEDDDGKYQNVHRSNRARARAVPNDNQNNGGGNDQGENNVPPEQPLRNLGDIQVDLGKLRYIRLCADI